MHRPFRALIFALLLLQGCATQPIAAPVPRASSEGNLQQASPIPIVIVDGSGESMGRQAGEVLKSSIATLHAAYMRALFQDALSRDLALRNALAYERFISSEYLEEIRALSEASGVDYNHTLLSQCFLDIIPMVACSTVALPAEASPDGVARLARNLDFPSMGIADRESLIIIYKPAGKFHFATITWPGLIGALTGMNEHGLILANMEVTRLPAPAKAMPYVLLYRTVLEQCRTVDEAVAMLKRLPKQTANNVMLMDSLGHRAVVEINPPGITVRQGRPGEALLSTNHQRGQNYESPSRCWRYDRMLSLSRENFGEIDETKLQTIIQAVSVRHFTLQSMLFEPAKQVIYLSTGESAGDGPYHRIDLGALMR